MKVLRAYRPSELGKDGYPIAWHQGIKQLVRDLAGHRCIRCGHPYRAGQHGKGQWSPCDEGCHHPGPVRFISVAADDQEAEWRILTVHHLDGDKANCRWWNLLALCQRCHLIIQGRVNPAQIYPFEHSPWFKPYAAGYYAFHYLGEDLDRKQADARLEELLALELAPK